MVNNYSYFQFWGFWKKIERRYQFSSNLQEYTKNPLGEK